MNGKLCFGTSQSHSIHIFQIVQVLIPIIFDCRSCNTVALREFGLQQPVQLPLYARESMKRTCDENILINSFSAQHHHLYLTHPILWQFEWWKFVLSWVVCCSLFKSVGPMNVFVRAVYLNVFCGVRYKNSPNVLLHIESIIDGFFESFTHPSNECMHVWL